MIEDEPPMPPMEGGTPANADREFLVELGQRVRHIRAVRGMSRKTLAQVSGISERYLAQLESGAGNLSIILLRRVAQATGAPIEDLVADAPLPPDWPLIRELMRRASPSAVRKARELFAAEDGTAPQEALAPVMVNRIALIGMRCAGKSTLGRIAAEKLGWPFIELNKEIEAIAGLSLAEIFHLYGHDGHQRFEEKALRAVIARPGPMLVAVSGGIVAEPVSYDLLLSAFFTVWVRATPEEHMARVRELGEAFAGPGEDHSVMDELEAVLASREPRYARARAVLDTSGASVDRSAAELVELVEHYCERSCPWAIRHR